MAALSNSNDVLTSIMKKMAYTSFILLQHVNQAKALTCYCLGHCPQHPNDPTKPGICQAKPGAKCFAAVEEVLDPETGRYEPERTYGCLPPEETHLSQCKGSLVPHSNPTSIGCCDDENLCNKRLSPMYQSNTIDQDLQSSNFSTELLGMETQTWLIILATFMVCFLILVAVVVVLCSKWRKKEEIMRQQLHNNPELGISLFPGNIHQLIENSSGSGSGLPVMVQRTIAKQIGFHEQVGKGRYGDVWRGHWKSDEIAIKVFHTHQEESWLRESEIYQTVLLRHDNILRFIAADIRGTGGQTQMLLITDYHRLGSLFDYLRLRQLNLETMWKMAYSIADGLNYLHTEITGVYGKPEIAHRDIKSKNILVKDDLKCCIADFGLAVRFDREKNEIDTGNRTNNSYTKVGTNRYISPEILGDVFYETEFHCYKQADVYSFGLVLWELCRRTNKDGICNDFAEPYKEYDVRSAPSDAEMAEIVWKEKLRPTIPKRWVDHPLNLLITETWSHEPKSRPNMLNLKKRLKTLQHKSSSPVFGQETGGNKYDEDCSVSPQKYNGYTEGPILPKIHHNTNSTSTIPMNWVPQH